ncbi:hypothetical protein [Synechococcus sp. UW179A]|uniref:hypothetical protein n=1 Tax=Synechococcus sp. UW179A TaxID=2575510 RepID=UPI0010BE8169|nr:hypothetical protein [Synechococcus sp. UW179A]
MVFGVRSGKLDLSSSFIDESISNDFMVMYEKLVHESWTDSALRSRLIENPAEVFEERGFDVSELKEHGISIQMFETQLYQPGDEPVIIPLPRKPDAQILSEEELSSISGGSCSGTSSTAGTASCPIFSAGSTGSCGKAPSTQNQSMEAKATAAAECAE